MVGGTGNKAISGEQGHQTKCKVCLMGQNAGEFCSIVKSSLNLFPYFDRCFKFVSLFPQVPANHLLSASVMSAPAALAISKLSYPETSMSKGSSKDFDKLQKS